jgi:hypothetical protein
VEPENDMIKLESVQESTTKNIIAELYNELAPGNWLRQKKAATLRRYGHFLQIKEGIIKP